MPFSTALSGLNAAQTDLDIIANNITNSNTTGFKGSRAEFSDVYAVTQNSSNASGKGVRVSTISTQFSQGSIDFTENNLDLAISGKGFFRLDDQGSIAYTRAGAFQVDKDGYVVSSNGAKLTGFQSDSNGNLTGALGSLQVAFADSNPQATSTLSLGANLGALETVPAAFSATDPTTYNHSTATTVFDSLGASHVATMFFRKDAVNSWQSFTYVDGVEVNPPGGNTVSFDSTGAVTGPTTFSSISFNPGSGAANMVVDFDFANLTQFGSTFGVNTLSQDGFSTGVLNRIEINEAGIMSARYSTGRKNTLGQVALANFPSTQGLQPNGDTSFVETFNSGAPIVGIPGSTNLGLVQSGALEESNVDLTKELVDLISAQRSFQANAKVISTSGDITQTVINLGR